MIETRKVPDDGNCIFWATDGLLRISKKIKLNFKKDIKIFLSN